MKKAYEVESSSLCGTVAARQDFVTREPSSDLLQFLRSKNILPNGYFSLEEPDGTYTFYSVSRSGVLYTLNLEPAALSADDVWEKLDRIQKISREVFEQAQESLWDARRLARGLPTSRELKPVAEQFYKDYTQHYAEGRWKTVARYDEETIRHILNIVCSNLQGGGKNQQAAWDRMFRDLVQAKVFRTQRDI